MDLDSFSLTTLGLGSTLGLVIVTCIELSSRDPQSTRPIRAGIAEAWRISYTVMRYTFYGLIKLARDPLNISNGAKGHMTLSREQILLGPTVSIGRLRIELEEAWLLLCDITNFFLLGSYSIIYGALHAQKTYRLIKKEFEARYGKCSKRTFEKLFRILKIWEPLPYDMMRDMPKEERERPMEKKAGLIGVCLRFREGTLEHRLRRNWGWKLHSREVSFPAYFPLEEDGSLSVDFLREKFSIEEIEMLLPGRYDILRASSGDRISPISLHVLTEVHGYLNIVEHEDTICQTRRRFRQWLRASLISYLSRIVGYASVIILSVAIGVIVSSTLTGRVGWYLNHSLGITVAACMIRQYLNYRCITSEPRAPWYAFPERYPRYWLHYSCKMDAFRAAIYL